MPVCRPILAGRAYEPLTPSEGKLFSLMLCGHCVHKNVCAIRFREKPAEYIYDAEGWPTCTTFKFKTPPAKTPDLFAGAQP